MGVDLHITPSPTGSPCWHLHDYGLGRGDSESIPLTNGWRHCRCTFYRLRCRINDGVIPVPVSADIREWARTADVERGFRVSGYIPEGRCGRTPTLKSSARDAPGIGDSCAWDGGQAVKSGPAALTDENIIIPAIIHFCTGQVDGDGEDPGGVSNTDRATTDRNGRFCPGVAARNMGAWITRRVAEGCAGSDRVLAAAGGEGVDTAGTCDAQAVVTGTGDCIARLVRERKARRAYLLDDHRGRGRLCRAVGVPLDVDRNRAGAVKYDGSGITHNADTIPNAAAAIVASVSIGNSGEKHPGFLGSGYSAAGAGVIVARYLSRCRGGEQAAEEQAGEERQS